MTPASRFDRLQQLTERLDEALRFHDLRVRRTVGGRLDRLCGVSRHTLPALELPIVLCALLILAAPSWSRAGLAALASSAAGALLVALMRLTERRQWEVRTDLYVQAALVGTLAAGIWVFAPDTYRPHGVYAHLLVPLAAALALSLILASSLVAAMFKHIRTESQYPAYLGLTELFASRGPVPTVTAGTIATALVTVLVRSPLALLILPALATLLAIPVWLPWLPIAVLLVCLALLLIAGVNERFGAMWTIVLAPFTTGGASLVSALLIVLGFLRLSGVTYVTTVFDTAAWRTIGVTLAGAYVMSWWYDYWSNRLVADQVMGMLHRGDAASQVVIPYDIGAASVRTTVPAGQRTLQIHGAGRFIALQGEAPRQFFQSYTVEGLLDLLAASGAPGGKAVPTPLQVRARIANFHTISVLVIAAVLALGAWHVHNSRQLAEATVTRSTGSGLSLSELLQRPSSAVDRPLILVAASGGGTRAALYTASVLEGLARLARTQDVVLGSGVSGGGAALAYFAANRPRLASATLDQDAWQQYFDVMRQPFIEDVLDRASELRMVGRGRLGILLANSFKERWQLPAARQSLAGIGDMGLLFNTSLAGHLELPAAASGELVDVEPEFRHNTKSTLAGGRLVLTNLQLPAGLEQQPLEPGARIALPVIVRSDELRLEDAAALNANFPPVFSNAAIDVDRRFRYWVTDGGAVDNRGLEMLLFAVRLSLLKLGPAASLPRLHIIIIDASALSDRYTQDRGVGSTFGGGTQFASHLNAELVASIRGLYGAHADRFGYSYLMMPDLLRTSGSFGTHWMLQSRIRVQHELEAKTIDGDEMIRILRALHSSDQGSDLSGAGCTVLGWSLRDPSYASGWLSLLKALSSPQPVDRCRHG